VANGQKVPQQWALRDSTSGETLESLLWVFQRLCHKLRFIVPASALASMGCLQVKFINPTK